ARCAPTYTTSTASWAPSIARRPCSSPPSAAGCRSVPSRGAGAMISITSKSPYAVLALAELGRSAGSLPVPIGELARRRGVPVQFLEQLFAALRRAGIVSSQRGVQGGYRLSREAPSACVLEIAGLPHAPAGRDPQRTL